MNFQEIKTLVAFEKLLAERYFRDQSVPLDERWAAFVAAPDYLKNGKGNICSELDEYFGEDVVMFDGVFHADRYARYETSQVVELLEEEYSELDEVDLVERIPLKVIKEKILHENFGFFEYDW